MPDALQVVFLDNVDSFTYNLVDEFARRGSSVAVFRNDVPPERVLAAAAGSGPRLLVVSPGPGTPSAAGSCLEVVRGALGAVPLFGVCLGHQALVQALGGTVERAPVAVHGKASWIRHRPSPLFDGLPNPMPVGRYHSLVAGRIPPVLESIADADGLVMAASHRAVPALSVQFHPESVLTASGGRLIDNVIRWASDASQ
jgi:anthranilate synthase component II